MRPARPALLLVLALVASGCAGAPAKSQVVTHAHDDVPQLEGWVFDVAAAPIEGAHVVVNGVNATTLTGPDGHYAFTGLPFDAPLVVVADADRHVPSSKAVTLQPDASILLNFTLAPVPTKTARIEVLDLAAHLSCEVDVVLESGDHPMSCGGADPNHRPTVEFAVGPDTVGALVEVEWTPSSPASEQLRAILETSGYGDQDQVLDTKAGKSVLRLQLNGLQAMRYYAQGGRASITVAAGASPEEDEQQAGVSAPIQQTVHLLVSVFYVEAPSPAYTAIK